MTEGAVLFRCKECGKVSVSLGRLHGHIERHRGYTFLNIQVPFTRTSPANVDELMERTECVRVTGTETLPLEAVEEPERTRYGPGSDEPLGVLGRIRGWL